MEKCVLFISMLIALSNSFTLTMKQISQFPQYTGDRKDYIEKEINTFGRNVMYWENELGQAVPITLGPLNDTLLSTDEDLNKVVSFRLYTPEVKNNYETLKINDSDALVKSYFNTNRPTRIVTHGYLTSADGPSCTLIRDAYLNNGNCNVITIDWSSIAMGQYVRARLFVESIGIHISSMINFLEKNGMNPNTTTIVGHSLGAHVMGIAGQNTVQKVNYLIGLDPALPLFNLVSSNDRISPNDAKFVEIIHTNGGLLGDSQRLGNFDFYPNGGSLQPGCPNDLTASICSHSRSYMYFAESLKNSTIPFYSLQCDSYDAFNSNGCQNFETIMGGIDYVPQKNGTYYLNTNSTAPYSLGKSYGRPDCSGGILNFLTKLINFFTGFGYSC